VRGRACTPRRRHDILKRRRVDRLRSPRRRQTRVSLSSDQLEPGIGDGSRYQFERKLGQGGAGAVYLVRDLETGEWLALKKLLRIDNTSVLRLKREFRALADLHHPNLIKLYDLERDHEAWFITMEYLQGPDLLSYLRNEPASSTLERGLPANTQGQRALRRSVDDVFAQLARGIHALHRAGMLHRDLKPSNVLVQDGRVVVLDFGLIRELGDAAITVTIEDTVAGTPAYMAPEQVGGSVLSEATDWYAFGVMLYQALSGALPIDGGLLDLLRRKLDEEPTPLSDVVSDVAPELAALCMGLVQRDPVLRPGFERIIEVLAPTQSTESSWEALRDSQLLTQSRHRALSMPLFGRAEELAQLDRALAEAAEGHFVVVHVRGSSGAGKSTLVEHFVEAQELKPQPVPGRERLVLRSRCYEREAMPFKALDGLMDALVNFLERSSDLLASHMLPAELSELARAFPILERLHVVQRLLAQAPLRGEPQQERSRAELALHELLRRVASRVELVLWIDDLQWADLDSVRMLKSWHELAHRLPALLILTYRSDELATNACLRALSERQPSAHLRERIIDLRPLSAADVEALCKQRLGPPLPEHEQLIRVIVREAQGSPFFASQLLILALAKLAQGERDLSALSIEGLVLQSTALLPADARELLNVLAVAGRPMAPRLALIATNHPLAGRSQLHALRSLGLTRTRVANNQRLIEVYHDRVREAVLDGLDAEERTRAHRSLLAALETSGIADPDWLHVVALGAGARTPALRYGLLAAERARTALAFERAAELYLECLGLADAAHSGELWLKRATVLSSCGLGSRAGRAYLEAAQRSSGDQALALTRLAASNLLRSGHYEEGEALVQKVLAGLQFKVPRSEAGLLAAIGWERARLALRGLQYTPCRLEDAPPQPLATAYMFLHLSIDTQAYDPVRAALFQARALRLALDLGVEIMIVGAFCAAAIMRSVSGAGRDERIADDLLARAERIALALDEPLPQARAASARAMTSFLLGRPAAAIEYSFEADRLYRANPRREAETSGEYYHRFAVAAARVAALFQLGEYGRGIVALQHELSAARASENRTAVLHLSFANTIAEIVQNQSERACERLRAERAQLPPASFGALHLLHMAAVVRAACASGQYAWARATLDDLWPRFEASPTRRSVWAQFAYAAHAHLVLNQHVLETPSEDLSAALRSDLKALAEHPQTSRATVTRLEARLRFLHGDKAGAIARYREHIEACQLGEQRDEVARGRFALGRLLEGEPGRQLCEAALVELAAIGVLEPLGELSGHFPELLLDHAVALAADGGS
jgi:serine/threonine protein kinase